MQTFQIEVTDNIADKVLALLKNFSEVNIKKIKTNIRINEADNIALSVKNALTEVQISKKENKKLQNAWDLLDEL